MKAIGVAVPECAFLELDEEVRAEVCGTENRSDQDCPGTLILGYRYPVNPEQQALYDFLPDRLLERVVNLNDFGAMIPIDLLVGASQPRSAMYWATGQGPSRFFRASMTPPQSLSIETDVMSDRSNIVSPSLKCYEDSISLRSLMDVTDSVLALSESSYVISLVDSLRAKVAIQSTEVDVVIGVLKERRRTLKETADGLLRHIQARLLLKSTPRKTPRVELGTAAEDFGFRLVG